MRGMNRMILWPVFSKAPPLSAVEPHRGDQQHEVLSATDWCVRGFYFDTSNGKAWC